MSILKNLEELLDAGVINEETAIQIQQFYETKEEDNPSRLILVFGILGALLVGLGIILILAHNWDDIPRNIKTLLGFIPLIVGQVACGWTLLKKNDSLAWRESSAVFLFFAIGASIALIGQIYNIPGNLKSFLFTWMLLALPLLYVMRSSMVSVLYLIGILAYTNSFLRQNQYYQFYPLFLAAMPHYYLLLKEKPLSNFTNFHHWLIPASLLITLNTLVDNAEIYIIPAACSLLGLFYLIGQLDYFKKKSIKTNGYLVIGSLGTIIFLLVFSFREPWHEMESEFIEIFSQFHTEIIASIVISVLALGLLIYHLSRKSFHQLGPQSFIFLLFIPIFFIGLQTEVVFIVLNILLFCIGVWTIRKGIVSNSLGILNYGLLIITALIAVRFFDGDLSFVIRGILFVIIGLGFFASNYWMMKNRKKTIANG